MRDEVSCPRTRGRCEVEEQGTERLIFQLVDDPLVSNWRPPGQIRPVALFYAPGKGEMVYYSLEIKAFIV